MAVHRSLGPGFLKPVYRNARALELKSASPEDRAEAAIPMFYRGEKVGDFFADLVFEGLIVELKAAQENHPAHEAQLVNDLQAPQTGTGLLLNLGSSSLGIKRKYRRYSAAPSNTVIPVHPAPRAFTLLELLVAMAVLAILVVMLMGLVTSATTLWRQNENRADAFREARAAMTIISRDLANLVVSTNTNHFLLNEAGAFDRVPAGAETNTARAGAAFFLAALPLNAQEPGSLSDVCEVGYFMGFERTSAGGNGSMQTLNLYRFFRSSNPTFSRLTNNTTFTGAAIGPAGEEMLARNIREFRITPLVYSNNAYSTNFTPSTNKPVPDALEISITAVNQEAARRFSSKAEWVAENPPAALTNAQQTFTTRIRLRQLPPPPP